MRGGARPRDGGRANMEKNIPFWVYLTLIRRRGGGEGRRSPLPLYMIMRRGHGINRPVHICYLCCVYSLNNDELNTNYSSTEPGSLIYQAHTQTYTHEHTKGAFLRTTFYIYYKLILKEKERNSMRNLC